MIPFQGERPSSKVNVSQGFRHKSQKGLSASASQGAKLGLGFWRFERRGTWRVVRKERATDCAEEWG
jgi:hypothetical protein